MSAISLSPECLDQLRSPIMAVWSAIGYDAEPLCDGDNEAAVELCIDADRFYQYLPREKAVAADDLIRKLIVRYTYHKVLTALSRRFWLV